RHPRVRGTEGTVTAEDERAGSERRGHGDLLVGGGLGGAIVVRPVAPAPFGRAVEAAEKYRAAERHPFPGCFVCGPDREPGDGLCLEPGPVGGEDVGEGTVAAPWVPAEAPAPEIVWAVLDCPGGLAFGQDDPPVVLGTMTAQVTALPEAGERCVVMGLARSREGRKLHAASALYGEDGLLLGRAEQIW